MLSAPVGLQKLVAIVEDDPAVLRSLEFALEADGHAVCGYENALDARASDRIMGADCLILDYAMPHLSGTALLGTLRERGLKCPAIIIASNPTARCRLECEAAGAPLVEKPLIGPALGNHIREALDRAATD